MELTKTSLKYKRELQALAESLPFKQIELPEFKKAAYKPKQIRQERTYSSFNRDMQAIGSAMIHHA